MLADGTISSDAFTFMNKSRTTSQESLAILVKSTKASRIASSSRLYEGQRKWFVISGRKPHEDDASYQEVMWHCHPQDKDVASGCAHKGEARKGMGV